MGLLPPINNSIDDIQYVDMDSYIGEEASKDGDNSERAINNKSRNQKSPELHTVNEYNNTP